MPAKNKSKSESLCIVPGCKNKRKWRGCCCGCYFEARRIVEAGEDTDEGLIKKKLILPARPGRRGKSAMSKIFAK